MKMKNPMNTAKTADRMKSPTRGCARLMRTHAMKNTIKAKRAASERLNPIHHLQPKGTPMLATIHLYAIEI